ARNVPSITNKNIFLTIFFLPCPCLRTCSAHFDTQISGVWLQEGGNTDFVPLGAPNLNSSLRNLGVLCASAVYLFLASRSPQRRRGRRGYAEKMEFWTVISLSAFSLGFFVVNIFCVQPKLTVEEANATKKFHSPDLRLRLHAVTYISFDKLPAWHFRYEHRDW